MWRAFFFAVGYLLIFLGVQSLVFERVQLSPKVKIPGFARRILQEPSSNVQLASDGNVRFAGSGSVSPPSQLPSYSNSSIGGLGYGPSRFNEGGVGGSSFTAAPYRNHVTGQSGSLGVGSGGAVNVPRVDSAGYRSPTAPTASPFAANSNLGSSVIEAQDWMPWSLLASGLVIVLYTRSFGRRAYSSE